MIEDIQNQQRQYVSSKGVVKANKRFKALSDGYVGLINYNRWKKCITSLDGGSSSQPLEGECKQAKGGREGRKDGSVIHYHHHCERGSIFTLVTLCPLQSAFLVVRSLSLALFFFSFFFLFFFENELVTHSSTCIVSYFADESFAMSCSESQETPTLNRPSNEFSRIAHWYLKKALIGLDEPVSKMSVCYILSIRLPYSLF